MEKPLYCNDCFTFHASWIKAMQFIKSQTVRNRLVAAIVKYGLTRVHTSIGNPVADAILCLVVDMIDRESPRVGEKSDNSGSTPDMECTAEESPTDESSVDEYSAAADTSERPCALLCDSREADPLLDEVSVCGDSNLPQKVNGGGGIRRKPKSNRRARSRKYRR